MFEFYLKYGLAVSILAVFTLAPAIAFLQARIIRRLRRDHRSVWEQLGNPHIVPVHPRRAWRVTGFLWQRRYRSIRDERLVTLCRLTNALSVPYLIFLALGVSWPFVVLASR